MAIAEIPVCPHVWRFGGVIGGPFETATHAQVYEQIAILIQVEHNVFRTTIQLGDGPADDSAFHPGNAGGDLFSPT